MFDHSKLRGKIKEVFGFETKYAKELGKTNTAINNKLNGKTEFTPTEILKTLQLLEIPEEEYSKCLIEYFFTPKVEKVQQKQ